MHVTHRPRSHERPNRPRLLQAGCRKARRTFVVVSRRTVASATAPLFTQLVALNVAAVADVLGGARSCANRASSLRAPAGSDDARKAPAVKTYRWLAQVTPPSDGLPAPSSTWTAQRSLSSACSSQASCKPAPTRRPLRALGQRLDSMSSLPTGTRHRRQERVQPWHATQQFCTNREWCPESLVDPATLRRSGRTETLTGQAAHTSRTQAARRDRSMATKEA